MIRRRAVSTPHRMRAYTFPAPVRGLVLNESLALAQPGGALVLDNMFPTTTGARLRGGKNKYATLGTVPVRSLWTYKSGATEKFFGSTETAVFDITTVADNAVAPTAVIQGQTSGYYSTQQFGTAGADFVVAVNGTDVMWRYDGTEWLPCNGAAIRKLPYDTGTLAFARGQVVTGGTSGATATIVAIIGTTAAGTLLIGPVTGGPFQNNETLTSATGSALANGADSAGSSVTITGVATNLLSQVWSHASRLFFVEKDSMSAWYLPVDSLGGAANEFSLAGVFRKGGSLLFGATWSLDAGDGLDDKCVFFSTEGEVAVYEGLNPGDAADWRKVGVYQVTKPLGHKGIMQAGGDLLVATETGLVPLSEALKKDVAALSLAAVSRNIEPFWKRKVEERRALPWEVLKWSANSMMVVSLPRSIDGIEAMCIAANMETGAWGGPFTGWDTRCMAVFGNTGYFGSNDGKVYAMEVGGSDDGSPYVCTYVGQFDHLKAVAATKTMHQARATFVASSPFIAKVSASVDYTVRLPAAPASTPDYASSEWDLAQWDISSWDSSESASAVTRWVSIGRTGFTHAPQVQVTCGVTPTPSVELVSVDVLYTPGGMSV